MQGKTIGRYEILAELGRGGFGVVWKARHTLLPDRVVALKVLSESHWSSPQSRRRFLQEAMAVSRLDHPSIATLYDAEEADGQLFIAFKLIEGETVGQQAKFGPMPLLRAVRVARDAAEALAHAHAHGVIHRDVSPGNIMVDREGRGVLVDFGLARAGDQSMTVTTGLIAGTLPYMPPERLRGGAADERTDIYGLGAVLYRMITGLSPFRGETTEQIANQVLHGTPDHPSKSIPSVPAELDTAVLRMMERDPRDRFGSASEVAEVLEKVRRDLAARDGATVRLSPVARALSGIRRKLRRRTSRWAMAAAATVLVGLGALGVAWTAGWRPWWMGRMPVVAILPARNLSEDQGATAYLAEAFGEDLVTRLGQLSNVRLVPWLTTQRFTDPKQSLQSVGHELRADNLIVGSYRTDGDQIRVTVALVNARSGLQTWSQVYEEPTDEILVLQQDVARGIASHLRADLTAEERGRIGMLASRSPEAYEYYLRGADFMNSQDPRTVALAGRYFDKALELDPELAVAWVGEGAVHTDLHFRGQEGKTGLDLAERAFRRAMVLQPSSYAAIRGLIRVHYERAQINDILRIARALAGRRDVEALECRGWAYTLGGLPERAVSLFDRVLDTNPASQSAAWYRVVAESWSGDARVIKDASGYIKKYGEDPEVYTWLGVALYKMGERAQTRLCFMRALELFGEDQSNIYTVLYAVDLLDGLGEKARADSLAGTWFDILQARYEANPDNGRVRGYRAALGARKGDAESLKMLDSVIVEAAEGKTLVQSEILSAIRDVSQLRRALVVLQDTPSLLQDYSIARSGGLQLSFGSRYEWVVNLPEFRRYLEAMREQHDRAAQLY